MENTESNKMLCQAKLKGGWGKGFYCIYILILLAVIFVGFIVTSGVYETTWADHDYSQEYGNYYYYRTRHLTTISFFDFEIWSRDEFWSHYDEEDTNIDNAIPGTYECNEYRFVDGIMPFLILSGVIVVWLIPIIWQISVRKTCKNSELVLMEDRIYGEMKSLFRHEQIWIPLETMDNIISRRKFWDVIRGGGGYTLRIASSSGFVKFPCVQNAIEFVSLAQEQRKKVMQPKPVGGQS